MWATAHAPLSIYTSRGARRKPTKKDGSPGSADVVMSPLAAPDAASTTTTTAATQQQEYRQPSQQQQQQRQLQLLQQQQLLRSNGLSGDLLGPAIEGPPSPERIRALSKQMQRANALEKHQSRHSHQTTSSGSSSLRSHASDRPSWEQTLENFTLSRRSSGRSTASSMPSHRGGGAAGGGAGGTGSATSGSGLGLSASSAAGQDRDTVQIFGKSLFNRRGKLKRDPSNQSSSGSSLYSAELQFDGGAASSAAAFAAAAKGPPPLDNSPATAAPFLPSVFTRRRTMRLNSLPGEDSSSPAARKLQISAPYNFQHVTHTRRDHLPHLQRASRMELVSDFSAVRAAQAPTPGVLRGIQADDLHFADFSSEALPLSEDPNAAGQTEPHTRITLTGPVVLPNRSSTSAGNLAAGSTPKRLVKHTRSHENLRISPPRPPRPAGDATTLAMTSSSFGPPIPPPPRVSSRLSINYDGGLVADGRPQTSSGFRHPQPFGLLASPSSSASPNDPTGRPPATSHGFVPSGGGSSSSSRGPLLADPPLSAPAHFLDGASQLDPRFSHALTTPDDAAWPLTAPAMTGSLSFDASVLPDVPEEVEDAFSASGVAPPGENSNMNAAAQQGYPFSAALPGARVSRVSVASNASSLRRSQSVPMLRRPPSGASDTLGPFEASGAVPQQPQRDGTAAGKGEVADQDDDDDALLPRESWEDDIDYCYEHEAEADFDYAWDRPSLDVPRDDGGLQMKQQQQQQQQQYQHQRQQQQQVANAAQSGSRATTPATLATPGRFDVPALSPASQASRGSTGSTATAAGQDVPPTPTTVVVVAPLHHQQQQYHHHHQQYHQQYQQQYQHPQLGAVAGPPVVVRANFSLPRSSMHLLQRRASSAASNNTAILCAPPSPGTPSSVVGPSTMQRQQQQQHQQLQPQGGNRATGSSSSSNMNNLQVHGHSRTPSYASSFKESHGFHLSPSLLIPGDFRQQMMLAQFDPADDFVIDPMSPFPQQQQQQQHQHPAAGQFLQQQQPQMHLLDDSDSASSPKQVRHHRRQLTGDSATTGEEDELPEVASTTEEEEEEDEDGEDTVMPVVQHVDDIDADLDEDDGDDEVEDDEEDDGDDTDAASAAAHDRHVSATSSAASTALTRLTMSTTSLDHIEAWVAKGSPTVVTSAASLGGGGVGGLAAARDDDEVDGDDASDDDTDGDEGEGEELVMKVGSVVDQPESPPPPAPTTAPPAPPAAAPPVTAPSSSSSTPASGLGIISTPLLRIAAATASPSDPPPFFSVAPPASLGPGPVPPSRAAAAIYHRPGRPLTRDLRSRSDADLLVLGGRRAAAAAAAARGSYVGVGVGASSGGGFSRRPSATAANFLAVTPDVGVAASGPATAPTTPVMGAAPASPALAGLAASSSSSSAPTSAVAQSAESLAAAALVKGHQHQHRRGESTKSVGGPTAAGAASPTTATRSRQRARTTSLSTPPPPGQYALFPSKYVVGSRGN